MQNRLRHNLEEKKENAEVMLEQLKDEEQRAKVMLDAKISNDQEMEILTEDAADMAARRKANRDNLIKLRIKLSQLQTEKATKSEEYEKLQKENEDFIKSNEEFREKNEKLDAGIKMLIQRIDLNALLKEIDVEELSLMANNNAVMNKTMMQLLNKWEAIEKPDQ